MNKLDEYVMRFCDITERQAQVLVEIMQGRTSQEIATELNICCKTVEKHRTTLRNTFDAENSMHAAVIVTRKIYRHNIKQGIRTDPFECLGSE